MHLIISTLKLLSHHLIISTYKVQDISKILHLLSDFLKKAPDEYFEHFKSKKSFKEMPLYLTEKGRDALKGALAEYPSVFEVGRLDLEPGFKNKMNVIYVIGQFLTAVATHFDYFEINDKKKYKENKDKINNLYKIWGSREGMNAYHLFKKFESKSNEVARQELEKKLSESASIMEKIDL